MNLLQQARTYAQIHKEEADPQRPLFHLTSATGWINDPNGFSVYQGEYHLFFQHYPFDTVWGSMHWGHAKTKDFIHWELLPPALAPDQDYDKSGCFSGSAIELSNGKQLIMYTGVTPMNYNGSIEKKAEEKDDYQNQCIAIGDGIDYIKCNTNPVLLASTTPEGGSLVDFRDPKIWKEQDHYYAVISNRPADGSGDILLYESSDALHWTFLSVLISNNHRYGTMWECPDLFFLDGHHVLLVSPMEMKAKGLEYHPGHGTMAIMGNLDSTTHTFQEIRNQAIDYGTDFYSTQTLETPDHRRIMIAWMKNWATIDMRPKELKVSGQMTFPRELHLVNQRLIQNPVKEIENCRVHPVIYQNILLKHQDHYLTLPGVSGRILDMTITLAASSQHNYHQFQIQLAQDEEHAFQITVLPQIHMIHIDRSQCGCRIDAMHQRSFQIRTRDNEIKLRILMDKYSVELFVNDGEQAASSVFYTDLSADGIRFCCDGEALFHIEKYDLDI